MQPVGAPAGSEPQPALGPRGTVVVGTPRSAPKVGVPSDKAVAGQIVIGAAAAPRSGAKNKVDVSRVDPRRAPTQKIARRPEAYLPAARKAPAKSGSKVWLVLGIAVVLSLTVLVVMLFRMLLKQRTGQ